MSDLTQEWIDAMMKAFSQAASAAELWEYGGADSQEEAELHRKASDEVAERIRKSADRYYARAMRQLTAATLRQ